MILMIWHAVAIYWAIGLAILAIMLYVPGYVGATPWNRPLWVYFIGYLLGALLWPAFPVWIAKGIVESIRGRK